jgi:hypothetical protein
MTLEKIITSDRIEITANGSVQVRMRTSIYEDGKEISSNFYRYVVTPGESLPDDAPQRVKDIVSVVHTPDVISAYKAKQEAANLGA